MKKTIAFLLVLTMMFTLCACSKGGDKESKPNQVTIQDLKEAVANSAGKTCSFSTTKTDSGTRFSTSFSQNSGFASTTIEISGTADKKENVREVEFKIKNAAEYYDSVTLEGLQYDMRYYQSVPMGKLSYETALMRYVPIYACLVGMSDYNDFTGLTTVLNAKDTAKTSGDWTFNMKLDNEDSAVITAVRNN